MARGVIGMNGLAYMGVKAVSPPEMKRVKKAPTTGDTFSLNPGDFWLYLDGKELYQLMDIDGGNAFYAKIYSQGFDGQVLIGKGDVSGKDNPSFAYFTSNDGSINFTLGPNSLDMSATATGFTWTTVSTDTTLVANNGYVVDIGSSSRIVFTIPAAAAVGDVFKIRGLGAVGWKVAQLSSQKISSLEHESTPGVTGYIESTHKYNDVDLECVSPSVHFRASNKDGNITIV